MKTNEYVAIAFFIGSLAFFYVGYNDYKVTKDLIRNGTITEGVVIQIIEQDNIDDSTFYPVFQYKDKSNRLIKFKSSSGSSHSSYDLGDKVEILHSDDNTVKRCKSFLGFYGRTTLFFGIAVFIFLMGLMFYFGKTSDSENSK